PTITVEDFIMQRQTEIQKLTDQQITQMQRILRVTGDDDPEKAGFYFRLGELYGDKQRYTFFQARALDQKIFDAPPNAKSRLQNQQREFDSEQETWLKKAIEAYLSAAKYKKYARMDEVLFKVAFMLQQAKREDQAREFFHKLIKDFPNSKYVPNA